MLLFRSEEHVTAWAARTHPPASTILSLEQIAGLAHAWYGNKLAPDWRRHTPEEAAALFARLGLDPEFWRPH
ncbi:MAG: hypothetical protein NVSMB8_08200 [Candidatus Limnocylindrales bacterium]